MQQVRSTTEERKAAVLRAVAEAGGLHETPFVDVLRARYENVKVARWQYFRPPRGGEGLLTQDRQGKIVLTGKGQELLSKSLPRQGTYGHDTLRCAVGAPMHPRYLPFSEGCVRSHFVHAAAAGAGADKYLSCFRASLEAAAVLAGVQGAPTRKQVSAGRQMEKDERFWVTSALLSLLHDDEGGTTAAQRFAALLRRSGLPELPGHGPWEQALQGPLELYFEASLPSPPSYKDWLQENLRERALVPYVRESAAAPHAQLEGSTKVDALLLAPSTGASVLFEAKVLSDVSKDITFDVARNQLARLVDVSLEPGKAGPLQARDPDKTCVVLLTPELLRGAHVDDVDHPLRRSRLYGWLFDAYRETRLLQAHLEHRREPERVTSAARRLGWAAWEDCRSVVPSACSWLPSPEPTA